MLIPSGTLIYPRRSPAGSIGSQGLTAASHRVGWLMVLPPSAQGRSIKYLTWRTGTVSTSTQMRIGIYTVNSSGQPTTTTYGGSAYLTRASVASNQIYQETLSTPTDASQTNGGDVVAVVVESDGGTPNVNVAYGPGFIGFPTRATYNGTAWSFSTNVPMLVMRYDDGTCVDIGGVPPTTTLSGNVSLTSSSNPREVGMRWTQPFGGRVVGVWASTNGTAGYGLKFGAYAGDAEIGFSSELVMGASSVLDMFAYFPRPVRVDAGTLVAATVYGNNATQGGPCYYNTIHTGEEIAYGFPLGARYISRASGGSWTETAGRISSVGLLFDQVDDGRRIRGRRGA